MIKLTKLALVTAMGLASLTMHTTAMANDVKPRPAKQYNLKQAMSDRAQLHTIAFAGLAFITGDFGYDTFLPPGKVSDYFGFQYMRDIDSGSKGHNTSFLTTIANNTLAVLNDSQKQQLLDLAEQQQADIERFALLRLPLIQAFRQNLEGEFADKPMQLDQQAVMQYSAELYELDGELAYQRAKVMGDIIVSLSDEQKQALDKLKFGDSTTWPQVERQFKRRGQPHLVNVAVMTYASEMFSWYAGSLEADTYFCPERHGMYFGGFGMKTAPAMGKKDYAISTSLTGDSGRDFLTVLNPEQRQDITQIIELQRQSLTEIAKVRRDISQELRLFQQGKTADKQKVIAWSKRYGELDGELSYLYGDAFAKVGQTLTDKQRELLMSMRADNPKDVKGPFLYSRPLKTTQTIESEFLFSPSK
ncbi:hypothetical protein [Vibrio hippocampi]|uniref:Uncharacterized protein n=1 Tax=Vibrio hippocampi TaxID=654686 RepID=A0ABM8ZNR6_9VIBR|nr:hypothetical protein [Vibrio hippocampi]CAH0530320.1 hypothetical protein VHP8226_03961 [Vibrio hippocampi]